MGDSFYNIFAGISLLMDNMPSKDEDSRLSERIRLQTEINGILVREVNSFDRDIDTLKSILINTPYQDRAFIIEEILRDALLSIENARSKYEKIRHEGDEAKNAYIRQFITLADATIRVIVDIIERMNISLSDVFVSEFKKANDGYYDLPRGDEGESTRKEEGVSNGNEEVKYTEGLLKLFHNHTELLEQLRGRSDSEIARMIKRWTGEKDKFGNLLIENPNNRLKSCFSRELKKSGIIKTSVERFSLKL